MNVLNPDVTPESYAKDLIAEDIDLQPHLPEIPERKRIAPEEFLYEQMYQYFKSLPPARRMNTVVGQHFGYTGQAIGKIRKRKAWDERLAVEFVDEETEGKDVFSPEDLIAMEIFLKTNAMDYIKKYNENPAALPDTFKNIEMLKKALDARSRIQDAKAELNLKPEDDKPVQKGSAKVLAIMAGSVNIHHG